MVKFLREKYACGFKYLVCLTQFSAPPCEATVFLSHVSSHAGTHTSIDLGLAAPYPNRVGRYTEQPTDVLTCRVQARMFWHRFGQHSERSFFEFWVVWFRHDVPIFLVERSELNPGRITTEPRGASSGQWLIARRIRGSTGSLALIPPIWRTSTAERGSPPSRAGTPNAQNSGRLVRLLVHRPSA